jgi:hypothetical protein
MRGSSRNAANRHREGAPGGSRARTQKQVIFVAAHVRDECSKFDRGAELRLSMRQVTGRRDQSKKRALGAAVQFVTFFAHLPLLQERTTLNLQSCLQYRTTHGHGHGHVHVHVYVHEHVHVSL